MSGTGTIPVVPGQIGELLPKGTRVDVFEGIFWVFVVLGTLVGVVVIGYMLYNAYKYRDDGSEPEGEDRPTLGELPEGGGKGRKLFLSFAISAIIVISLVVWTYAMLLYVESGTSAQAQAQATTGATDGEIAAQEQAGPLTVRVEGFQFGWRYIYPNGHETNTLYIPEDRRIQIRVTSDDVFHNYGIPAFRVKTDAIPGQMTETWFEAEETGTYQAKCYELCGTGHSAMVGSVEVMTQEEFQEWYADTGGEQNESEQSEDSGSGNQSQTHATATRVEVTP